MSFIWRSKTEPIKNPNATPKAPYSSVDSNVIIIPSFGLLAIFLMIYLIPRDVFDSAEMNEIRNNFLSRPLLNI